MATAPSHGEGSSLRVSRYDTALFQIEELADQRPGILDLLPLENLVGLTGIEPAHLSIREPKSRVSATFTTNP